MWELASFDVRVVLRNLGLQTLVSMALGGLKARCWGFKLQGSGCHPASRFTGRCLLAFCFGSLGRVLLEQRFRDVWGRRCSFRLKVAASRRVARSRFGV